MLSKMCQIAIKAVLFLCSRQDKESYVGIKQIAIAIDCSEHTVGKILQLLVKNQIIGSLKGPAGGYYITQVQKRLPILKIVEAIDGPDKFTCCGLGLSTCSGEHPCPIHFQYQAIREGLEKIFREKKVSDLCQIIDKGDAYLAG